ncbi:MAG: response regulator [Proteobacteria bacterium]|nr:response regulator [Pseudomonadota bacterium]
MPRILLVDDSALIRNAMHAALEPFGVEIGHAENGEVAVQKAMSSEWDLIFLDCVMPVMDGPTALAEIRKRGNSTTVVLVTSISSTTVVARAVKLGGVLYIGKPFTPDHIRTIAVKLLKLDPSVLTDPPRVLLQHVDPTLPARLARMLPSHIAIDASHSLAESIDLAEERPHGLVMIESADPLEEVHAIANVLRRIHPAAGVFTISHEATPGPPWRPDEGLDGIWPPTFDDALGRGFLYPTFLRPLTFTVGNVITAAGHQGSPLYLQAYLEMLRRALIARCAGSESIVEPQIDLRHLPPDSELVVTLVERSNHELRAVGAAPTFLLDRSLEFGNRLAGILVA